MKKIKLKQIAVSKSSYDKGHHYYNALTDSNKFIYGTSGERGFNKRRASLYRIYKQDPIGDVGATLSASRNFPHVIIYRKDIEVPDNILQLTFSNDKESRIVGMRLLINELLEKYEESKI